MDLSVECERDEQLCDIIEDMHEILSSDHPGGGMYRRLAERSFQERLDERAATRAYLEHHFGDDRRLMIALENIAAGAHLR